MEVKWLERYLDDLERVFRFFKANADENGLDELCEMRGYFSSEMKYFLQEYGVIKLKDGTDTEKLKGVQSNLGLFSEKGNFILKDRFIVPIKDMLGRVISFVGWYPDERKYITANTRLFKRSNLLFGLEQLPCKRLFVVEGIFDSLSLRALGFNAVAVMGAEMSLVQRELCNLCEEVICIPDNDKVGRGVLAHDKWKASVNNWRYLNWKGLTFEVDGEERSIKDIDLLCNLFEIKGVLNSIDFNGSGRIINLTKVKGD